MRSNGQTQGGGSGWTPLVKSAEREPTGKLCRSQFMLIIPGGDFSTDSAQGNSWFSQLKRRCCLNWEAGTNAPGSVRVFAAIAVGLEAAPDCRCRGLRNVGSESTGLGGGLILEIDIQLDGPRYTNSRSPNQLLDHAEELCVRWALFATAFHGVSNIKVDQRHRALGVIK